MNLKLIRITFLLICFAIYFSGCSENDQISDLNQEETLSWDYPIKPGTDAWKAFQSGQEMVDACQIPKLVLSVLSTRELVRICLNYPLIFDIYAANLLVDGVNSFEKNFNGFQELIKRKDGGTESLNYYILLQENEALTMNDPDKRFGYAFRMADLEIFLANPDLNGKLIREKRMDAVSKLFASRTSRKLKPDLYPSESLHTCYFTMISIIQNDSNSSQANAAKNIFPKFGGSFLPDQSFLAEADQIIAFYLAGK